jgi:hypothetical protein
VLQALAENNTVLVTIHGIEPEFYLESFTYLHFEETGDPEYPFVFKLKQGLCRSRNLQKLTARMSFLHDTVKNAQQITDNFLN